MNGVRAPERAVACEFDIGIAPAIHKLHIVLWKSVAGLPDNFQLRDILVRNLQNFTAIIAHHAVRCEHHHAAACKEQRAQAIEDWNKKEERHYGKEEAGGDVILQ